MEKRIRVGCYGAKGSYTYEAMERHFGEREREEIFFPLFEDVTKAVAGGMIDYGVVPIENSCWDCRERKWKISIRSTPIPRDLPSAVFSSMNIGIGN